MNTDLARLLSEGTSNDIVAHLMDEASRRSLGVVDHGSRPQVFFLADALFPALVELRNRFGRRLNKSILDELLTPDGVKAIAQEDHLIPPTSRKLRLYLSSIPGYRDEGGSVDWQRLLAFQCAALRSLCAQSETELKQQLA